MSAREAASALSEGNALRKQGLVDGAVAAYRRAVELAPGFPAGYYNLAIALREQGDLRGATLALSLIHI